MTIVVEVKNFKLSAAHFGKAPVKGGRASLLLARRREVRPSEVLARERPAGAKIGVEARYSPSVTNKITYTQIPEGNHSVVVYLVANNHKKLGPSASLTFPVQ